MKTKKRILSTALAVLLGVSAVLPTANVFADGAKSTVGPDYYYPSTNAPYMFNLSNHHNKADYDAGKKLTGAKYDLKMVGKMLKTGAMEKIDPAEEELTKATIDEVNKKELSTPGRYELTQVERPFGYLLGQGTDEHGKALDKVVVDFPIIDDKGQIAKTQVYNIAPKFTKVEKDFSFKKVNSKGQALPGVGFNIYALNLAEEGKYNELYGSKLTGNKNFKDNLSKLLIDSGTTDAEGKIAWNSGTLKLAEGSYFLEESSVPSGYRKQHFFVTLKAKAGLERTAAKLEDFEFVITKANTEKTPISSGAIENLTITNYNLPTPGNGDGTSGDAEFSKKVVNIGDKTTVQEGQNYTAETVLKAKDHAQFKLTFKTPQDVQDYETLRYVDDLDSAYTLIKESVVIKAGNETNPSWVKTVNQDNKLGLELIKDPADAKNVPAGQEVTVEFVVKVNRNVAVHGSTVNNGLEAFWGYTPKYPGVDPNGKDPEPDTSSDNTPNSEDSSKKIDPKDQTKTEIINSKTTIRTKDLKSKENIPNGTFIIEKKDEKGDYKKLNITPEIKTDTNGEVVIEDLPTGEYRIVNTKTPDGYKRKAAPQEFTIGSKPEDGKKTIENERIFYYDKDDTVGLLPSTGTLGTLPYLLSAGLLLGVFVALRKRNAEQN